MAGSYNHCVDTKTGKLLPPEPLSHMLGTGGDVYEAVEELYGMVWLLAEGSSASVENAREHYEDGLQMSPGVMDEDDYEEEEEED